MSRTPVSQALSLRYRVQNVVGRGTYGFEERGQPRLRVERVLPCQPDELRVLKDNL